MSTIFNGTLSINLINNTISLFPLEYSKLVEVYEQLNRTTKRLEKTHIISEFLKDVSAEDMEHVMLLLEGKKMSGRSKGILD
ncbi:hypothetical protein HYX04_02285 [Candidatus Woesearchaeota archaeon]|nr:hypothetical protein [Candidatus Woesearchaeota archaeon]